MPIKLILRLVLAVIFAIVAVIFSELIPPLNGVNPLLLKAFVTALSFGVGFLVFPDLATRVSTTSIYWFNTLLNKVTAEISSQIIRVFPAHQSPFNTTTSQVTGMTLQKPLILDTSAIIDGRILDIAKTGFLYGSIIVPSFVLTELQQVSDSSDFIKRSRGRKGFDTVEELKKVKNIRIEVWDRDVAGKAVDSKILQLAKNLNGRIITTDFNLNKLALVSGVAVLNVNDLANAVKAVAVPGEKIEVKIVHLGKESTQGVGYLPDGTMIIITNAADLVGKTVEVEVTKMLQMPAGRMIFGKKVN